MDPSTLPDPSTPPDLSAFSLHTTVYIDPTKLDQFWEAFKPVFDETSAAPECMYIEVFEDPAAPGKITWVTNWDASPKWVMTEHIKKPYYAPYAAATEPLFTKPRDVKFLKREPGFVSGKKGNFNSTIGDNNEGISFHVNVEIQADRIEEFRSWWKEIFPPVASEPECLYFEVFSDPSTAPGQPVKLSWMENWDKPIEWMMSVQLAKDYYKPYLAATEPMFAAPRHFEVLKRKEGYVAWKEDNFKGAEVGDYKL